jgi:hypothetical protein
MRHAQIITPLIGLFAGAFGTAMVCGVSRAATTRDARSENSPAAEPSEGAGSTAAVSRSDAPSRGDRSLNVLDYGAKGDGATDDSAAFAAAHAALPSRGGRLYIPAGDYRQTRPWIITKPVVIEGAGSSFPGAGYTGATRLVFDRNVPGLYVATTARVSRFANFNIVGSHETRSDAHGLNIRAQNGVYESVVISGFAGHGVFVNADGSRDHESPALLLAHFNTFINVKSRSNAGDGFRVQGLATYVQTFISTDASYNDGWGYVMQSNHQTLISPHALANRTGAFLDNGSTNYYLRPYIENSTGRDVRFDTAASSMAGTWVQQHYARAPGIVFTGPHRGWEVRTLGGAWESLVIHDLNGPVSDTHVRNARTYAFENGASAAGVLRLRDTTGEISVWEVDPAASRFNISLPLSIGSGTAIARHLSIGNVALDFPQTPSGGFADLKVALEGATPGDSIAVSIPADVMSDLGGPCGFQWWVSARNTVTVRFWNSTGSAKRPPRSVGWRLDLWQH